MKYESLTCRIRGTVPLLMHSWRLADPRNDIAKRLKSLSGKRAKTDADLDEMARLEWFGGLYLEGGAPCLPAEMIEALLIEAAKRSKRGPAAKAGIYCARNFLLIYDGSRDPHELWQNERFRFTTAAKIQRNLVMRTRPIFRGWEAELEIQYLTGLLNERDIQQFLEVGGEIIGLGDWRPKFGRFEPIH